ncbi:uncharacterized protein LOC129604243 [Betta splendens]|uniref:Uncharacterized protein LOC129604243 n=1 Tax=Betta splendens TaxID=158456 RepID=A0A9W2XVY1_BETSP|nr:uncharacterized protein LOC129604243 [Betta splendens]
MSDWRGWLPPRGSSLPIPTSTDSLQVVGEPPPGPVWCPVRPPSCDRAPSCSALLELLRPQLRSQQLHVYLQPRPFDSLRPLRRPAELPEGTHTERRPGGATGTAAVNKHPDQTQNQTYTQTQPWARPGPDQTHTLAQLSARPGPDPGQTRPIHRPSSVPDADQTRPIHRPSSVPDPGQTRPIHRPSSVPDLGQTRAKPDPYTDPAQCQTWARAEPDPLWMWAPNDASEVSCPPLVVHTLCYILVPCKW